MRIPETYQSRQTEYQGLRGFLKAAEDDSYRARLLKLAITEELTPRQMQMAVMYYYRQKTVRDIAQELGVNPSTVSRTLKAAREKLKRCMKFSSPMLLHDED